ncbi:MerR family transcriptional regulator [Streptomyces caatingaensis]|uniref:HTH merR-type domain-containing protein n=1 Tax=Streptomyces caatingaensis TaxID=1678637 RepID=A0A0K9XBF4_9ACTN|nr:MerR family transcriptional regulator [Streptomyces caatingaensis]KNB50548.1 hypothetical protein AC230_21620 [Streptomyces caatingaensis]
MISNSERNDAGTGSPAAAPVVIGEAGKRFGLSVATLRYWEERGLIQPTERRGGRRFYGPEQLHRIGLVQMWRETGLMSLDEIAVALAGESAERDWREAVQGRIDAIQEQVARLTMAKEHLEHLLSCPCDDPAAECTYLSRVVTERMRGNRITPADLHERPPHGRDRGTGRGPRGRVSAG